MSGRSSTRFHVSGALSDTPSLCWQRLGRGAVDRYDNFMIVAKSASFSVTGFPGPLQLSHL